MKAVGIKNLKNNLSRYLDMVREGELIYVTDRDEIIAEIHKPTSAPQGTISPWEIFLNQEERKGAVIRAKRKGFQVRDDFDGLEPLPEDFDWKAMLDEMREEGS